jgi:ribosomal protein S18 acetylase RimI-like enzyme
MSNVASARQAAAAEIVGTVTVIGDYIRMLAVTPRHQGQGIARKLLRTHPAQ